MQQHQQQEVGVRRRLLFHFSTYAEGEKRTQYQPKTQGPLM